MEEEKEEEVQINTSAMTKVEQSPKKKKAKTVKKAEGGEVQAA